MLLEVTPGRRIDRFTVLSSLGPSPNGINHLCSAPDGSLHVLELLDLALLGAYGDDLRPGPVSDVVVHPNLAAFTEIVEFEGVPVLVSEFVPGASLDRVLARHRFSTEQADLLARELCAGLGALHMQGFVHGAITPNAVVLDPSGGSLRARVVGHGLGQLLTNATGHLPCGLGRGAPAYEAPELEASDTMDAQADVFAVASILYEALTWARAFDGPDPAAVRAAVASGQFQPPRLLVPDLPERMGEALADALNPDRGKRTLDLELFFDTWSEASEVALGRYDDGLKRLTEELAIQVPEVPKAVEPAPRPAAEPPKKPAAPPTPQAAAAPPRPRPAPPPAPAPPPQPRAPAPRPSETPGTADSAEPPWLEPTPAPARRSSEVIGLEAPTADPADGATADTPEAEAPTGGLSGGLVVVGIGVLGAVVLVSGAAALALSGTFSGNEVIVASRDLMPGEAITSSDVKSVTGPVGALAAGTTDDASDIVGRTVRHRLYAGEAVHAARLSAPGTPTGLEPLLAPGTSSVDVALEGLQVEPGDHLELWGTSGGRTDLVVSGLVAVTLKEDGAVATVEVKPDEARRIERARGQGPLHTTLRADVDFVLELSSDRIGTLGGDPVGVYAGRALAPGLPINSDDLVLWPAPAGAAGGFGSYAQVANKIPHSAIFAGERIIERQLADPSTGRGVAALLGSGERAVVASLAHSESKRFNATERIDVVAVGAPPAPGGTEPSALARGTVAALQPAGEGCPCVVVAAPASVIDEILHAIHTTGVSIRRTRR